MRLAVATLLLLAGCSLEPTVQGNSRGGMIAGDTVLDQGDQQVWALANKHCAGYGKSARVTQISRGVGSRSALFDCL